MSERLTGVIVAVAPDYYFVRTTDGSDFFLHRSEVFDFDTVLVGGDRVEFEPVQHPRGPRAVKASRAR